MDKQLSLQLRLVVLAKSNGWLKGNMLANIMDKQFK